MRKNINIRLKTIGINAVAFAVLMFLIYSYVTPNILHHFNEIEQADSVQNLGRAQDALQNLMTNLGTKATDWAVWDNTYTFMQNKNAAYAKSTFGEKVANPGVDVALFYDKQGKLFYSYAKTTLPTDLVPSIDADGPLLAAAKNGNLSNPALTGFINTLHGTLIIAAQPILPSSGQGPARGTMIYGNYLTPGDIQSLAILTHLSLSMYPADSTVATLKSPDTTTKVLNEHTLAGYLTLRDVLGRPTEVIRVEQPRTIYQEGVAGAHSLLAIASLGGIAFIILIALVLDFVAVRRIRNLTNHVALLHKDTDLSERLNIKGSDEVAKLGTAIDHLLTRIQSSNKRIAELLGSLTEQKEKVEQVIAKRTRQLEDEKAHFLSTIQGLPLGFILADTKGNLLLINTALKEMLNLEDTSKETVHPLTKKLLQKSESAAKSGKFNTYEFTTSSGTFWQVFMSPITSATGELNAVAILVQDVTQARLQDRSRDEFFSIASHELRTPLTAIRGNTSMIKQFYAEPLKDEAFNAMVDDIYKSSVRLIDIVNEFLDVSRIEQDKIKFAIQDFSIEKVIESITYEMAAVLNEKKIYLKMGNGLNTLPLVHADPDRCKQVLYNLIGNAAKFVETGGITVKADVQPGNMLKVLIIDTGFGIPADDQERLFRKFQQTSNNKYTRDTTHGTGLGLYISKLLIEHMGGRIALESSEVGKGSTFSFTVPLSKQKHEHPHKNKKSIAVV